MSIQLLKPPEKLRRELLAIRDKDFFDEMIVDVRDRRESPDSSDDGIRFFKAKDAKENAIRKYIDDNDSSFLLCCGAIYKTPEKYRELKKYIDDHFNFIGTFSTTGPFSSTTGRTIVPPIELVYSYFLAKLYVIHWAGEYREVKIDSLLLDLELSEKTYRNSKNDEVL